MLSVLRYTDSDCLFKLFLSFDRCNWSACTKPVEITLVLKVETGIIADIAASQIRRAVILVIMYVETFRTDIIIDVGVKCHNDITLIDMFQYQSH